MSWTHLRAIHGPVGHPLGCRPSRPTSPQSTGSPNCGQQGSPLAYASAPLSPPFGFLPWACCLLGAEAWRWAVGGCAPVSCVTSLCRGLVLRGRRGGMKEFLLYDPTRKRGHEPQPRHGEQWTPPMPACQWPADQTIPSGCPTCASR